MFTHHFNFTDLPFVERLPVDRIFKDERTRQGLIRLQYLLSGGTIALLTGDTGAGKSCMLKLFLASLAENLYRPVYVHVTNIRSSSLLKSIVTQMGEIPRNTKERLFNQILERVYSSDIVTLLVCDEAQLITSEALTDLRLLVSSALDEQPPLKIIFSGQPALRKQIGRSCHRDLADRVSVKYHLHPLTAAQTQAYLEHHLRSVGGNGNVFDRAVKNLIFEFAGGIPRRINNIATACLIQAAAENLKTVSQDIFSRAARECQI